jgi:cell division control protein 6
MYRELCIRFGSEALTPRLGVLPIDFVSELDIHSILGLVKAIMVNKGRYGRTRAISLQIPEACVEAVVLEDYTLNALSTVCYGQKLHNR